MEKKRVLFICTHNSSRSQLAEGLMNHFLGSKYEARSAGTHPNKVNPLAIKVMEEIGIDLKQHRSKSLTEFSGKSFDVVVTVCDSAKEERPFFAGGKKQTHQSFEDPSKATGSEEEKLKAFRKVRDQIRKWIIVTFGE